MSSPLHAAIEPARAALRRPLTALFEDEPGRAQALTIETAGILADLSKTHIDPSLIEAAARSWEESGAAAWYAGVGSGAVVNTTEQRAAWHEAWRMQPPPATVASEIESVNAAMRALVADWRGSDARAVLHLGIGGSALGPDLALAAVTPRTGGRFDVRVVANVDAEAFLRASAGLDPRTTRVVVASKSWTTLETQANFALALDWLRAGGVADPGAHCAAITSKPELARAAGLAAGRIFPMPDWVGGRYSLWSAIGLPIALQLDWNGFEALRGGAAAIDAHARGAPLARNMPWLMALAGWLYAVVAGHGSRALFTYDERLRLLPAHLSQLEMESLGKGVTRDGAPLARGCVSLWGGVGTDVQHAVMQAVHQGPAVVPVDFVAVAAPDHDHADMHRQLIANMLAQAAVLLAGKDAAAVEAELTAQGMDPAHARAAAPHRVFPGNRPSTTLILDRLEPRTLGALIALYEQRTVMLGAMLGVNPFDQWGVEMGKVVARQLAAGDGRDRFDPSTAALAARLLG